MEELMLTISTADFHFSSLHYDSLLSAMGVSKSYHSQAVLELLSRVSILNALGTWALVQLHAVYFHLQTVMREMQETAASSECLPGCSKLPQVGWLDSSRKDGEHHDEVMDAEESEGDEEEEGEEGGEEVEGEEAEDEGDTEGKDAEENEEDEEADDAGEAEDEEEDEDGEEEGDEDNGEGGDEEYEEDEDENAGEEDDDEEDEDEEEEEAPKSKKTKR